jgi:hypothetical protein
MSTGPSLSDRIGDLIREIEADPLAYFSDLAHLYTGGFEHLQRFMLVIR